MVDKLFDDAYLASLYDRLSVDRGDEGFYLGLISCAPRVLDVGCGTGSLLCRARAAGHAGRLVGIDPAEGMLAQARSHAGVEWVHGYLPDAGFRDEFDLVYMTGHAFQVFQDDAATREFLAAARLALVDGGHLAFETRNPNARAWERWTPDAVTTVQDVNGTEVRVWHEVLAVDGQHVSFTETYAATEWAEPMVSRSTLRFVDAGHLDALLTEAGFAIHERYGYWDRRLFTADSPEIITVASTR